MKMLRRVPAAIALAASLAISLPLWAHHAFQAEFDDKKPVHLTGKVTKMEWINPHAWIHIDVTEPDGKKLFIGSQGTGAPVEQ